MNISMWFPWWLSGKECACQGRRCGFNPWVQRPPWRRKWKSPLVFLPGKSHGQRTLAGYSPWDREELDMIQQPNNSERESTCKSAMLISFSDFMESVKEYMSA